MKVKATRTEDSTEVSNPIKSVLGSRGLSPLELAIICGISDPVVYQVLHGSYPRIPKRILVALRGLGCDASALEKDYEEYRTYLRERLLVAQKKGGAT